MLEKMERNLQWFQQTKAFAFMSFARDHRRWLKWLFGAKKRYGLSVLNYMATSNHIHLLIRGSDAKDTIPEWIQLIAARTGQEFNQ